MAHKRTNSGKRRKPEVTEDADRIVRELMEANKGSRTRTECIKHAMQNFCPYNDPTDANTFQIVCNQMLKESQVIDDWESGKKISR